jgi:micrococcal nuclease
MSAPDRFCPSCGQGRTGYLRFCRSCGLDFEALGAEATGVVPAVTEPVDVPPVGGWHAPPKGRWGRRRYATVAVAAVIGLGAIGAMTPDPAVETAVLTTATPSASVAPSPTPTPAATRPAPTLRPTPTVTAAPTFGPAGPTEIATVTRVVDGDTIRVEIDGVEYPVRYIGINTPEPDAEDPFVKELADAATAANTALVEGREVILERDVSQTDPFDRLLRNVWIEDGDLLVLVNLELVRHGYAQVSTYPPDVKYADLLIEDERLAQAAEIGLWAPAPTPAPTVAPVVAVDDEPRYIVSDDRPRFAGVVGDYTWHAMQFETDRVTVRWSATAPAGANCRIAWQVQPEAGAVIKRTVRVEPGDEVTGNARYDTDFLDAAFVVDSTCPDWWVSMQGFDIAEPPQPAVDGGGNCDPSYPGVCIPPYPPDLDCGEISERRFTVIGSDPHGFDGDNDGIGCESG